ncbi:hypothetical protein IWW34DRAFT_229414 [Fusarium oxysporum f. sp. albedinis]|nr:hypothetical protein IWW34DRAFT_229414 [Fusarium oxysporum f. sp. albedinis]
MVMACRTLGLSTHSTILYHEFQRVSLSRRNLRPSLRAVKRLKPLGGPHDVDDDIMKLSYRSSLSPLLNFLVGRSTVGICRRWSFSYEKLHHSQINDVAETTKAVWKRVVENIDLVFQVVGDFVDHGVHVGGIIHHEVSNFRCDSIFSYELHDGFCHVLAAVLSLQFFYPHHKGLQAMIFGNELNCEPYYAQTIWRCPIVGNNVDRGKGILQSSLHKLLFVVVAPL